MAALQKFTGTEMSAGTSYSSCGKVADVGGGGERGIDPFPAGLRVLVVDDDRTCLRTLEMMLQKCLYQVTTCCQAKVALTLLRERKGGFDLVISDVHMPDMDGFKLLEHVGLEMDLPVIMMSADGRTSAVMKGIKHGACDYLIKPVRMEELKNIWQHVVRKKWNDTKENENSGSLDESDRQKRGIDDPDYASSVNDVADVNWKKKKRESKEDEDEGDLDNDDPSASKKPRVVWSVELHQQFVSAVNQLGIDKAVPKRILELMNVPGLTRENVASHLQKFRLYLKRLSGVTQHQGGLPSSYCGVVETNHKVNPLGRLDFQAFAASGQLPPQTLAAALHAELLGRPSGNMVLSSLEQPSLLQTSLPGPKFFPVDHGLGFSPPLVKCNSNIAKQFPQNNIILDDVSSGFSEWSASNLGAACSTSNLAGSNTLQNNNMLDQMLPQKQPQPVISDPIHPVNVQPSCLVIPSQSSSPYHFGSTSAPINPNSLLVSSQTSNSYQVSNVPVPINHNTGFNNRGTVVDYHPFPSQPGSSSFCVGQSNGHFKGSGLLNGYSVAGSLPSPMSSSLVSLDGSSGWKASNSVMNTVPSGRSSGISPNLSGIHSAVMNTVPDQVQVKNLGFVGKGTSIPSRFAVDDIESPTGSLSQRKVIISDTANSVKQEIHLDFMESSKGGNPVSYYYSPGDCMSIISK